MALISDGQQKQQQMAAHGDRTPGRRYAVGLSMVFLGAGTMAHCTRTRLGDVDAERGGRTTASARGLADAPSRDRRRHEALWLRAVRPYRRHSTRSRCDAMAKRVSQRAHVLTA